MKPNRAGFYNIYRGKHPEYVQSGADIMEVYRK